jgi:tRNA-dihydrouridine synthase 3
MARAAELIEREGVRVDFVDINCGCPLDLVCNKGMGAACMGKMGKLRDCVLQMDRILSCPVTLKMRTGLEKDENARFAHKIMHKVRLWNASRIAGDADADVLSRPPVAAITVHGRTRQQRYSAYADWGYIERCAAAAAAQTFEYPLANLLDGDVIPSGPPSARLLAALGVGADSPSVAALAAGARDAILHVSPPTLPVIGNGDVLSWQDWEAHVGPSGGSGGAAVASCMIARGALIKPWLPREIKERRDWDISSGERLDMLRDFVRFGLEHWGSDQQGVNHTRRFLLEWLSFLHRYIPVGLLERLPLRMNDRAPAMVGRDDLETLMMSQYADDWVKISELLLGPVPEDFRFVPKHKSSGVADGKADAEG